MKTIFRSFICMICLSLWTISCADFLTEAPRGRLATMYFFNDPGDLDASINALYSVVADALNGNHQTGIRCLAGDDISTHPASSKFSLIQHDQFFVTTSNPWIIYNWEELYRIVKAANFIINHAGKTPAPDTDINYTLAQAHYWRAYAYFHLVRTYGALPVVLGEEMDFHTPLTPVENIYDLVVADLLIAEGCRISYPNAPYAGKAVTQAGAKATLAYVYLSMAGWPLNRGTEYYLLAAAKAKEVIDGVENGAYQYELLDEYWKVYSMTYNYNNPELLVGVYYNKDTNGHGSPAADLHQDLASGAWNDTNGEIKFWKEFPDGPRKEATYVPKYLKTDGSVIDWWEMEYSSVAPFFMKTAESATRGAEWDYMDPNPVSMTGEKTRQIVRLSEVYCWYAEAVGRSGQTNAKAIELLNKVRNRADGSETNIYPAGMTPDQLAEAAYNEHGWEIAGYYWGNIAARWWDMFRMYRAKDHFEFRKLNPMIEVAPGVFRNELVPIPVPHAPGMPAEDDGVWSDKRMYSVPPIQDIELNPNLKNTLLH